MTSYTKITRHEGFQYHIEIAILGAEKQTYHRHALISISRAEVKNATAQNFKKIEFNDIPEKVKELACNIRDAYSTGYIHAYEEVHKNTNIHVTL